MNIRGLLLLLFIGIALGGTSTTPTGTKGVAVKHSGQNRAATVSNQEGQVQQVKAQEASAETKKDDKERGDNVGNREGGDDQNLESKSSGKNKSSGESTVGSAGV